MAIPTAGWALAIVVPNDSVRSIGSQLAADGQQVATAATVTHWVGVWVVQVHPGGSGWQARKRPAAHVLGHQYPDRSHQRRRFEPEQDIRSGLARQSRDVVTAAMG